VLLKALDPSDRSRACTVTRCVRLILNLAEFACRSVRDAEQHYIMEELVGTCFTMLRVHVTVEKY